MKKNGILILFKMYAAIIVLFSFLSCETIKAITIVDGRAYTNYDAYVAYEFYSQIYADSTIIHKPMIFILK